MTISEIAEQMAAKAPKISVNDHKKNITE